MQDTEYMRHALTLAAKAASIGEVPVGAVVVSPTGEIIGEGYNLREESRNPLTHAEIIAINEASKTLGAWRLIGCTIYVTLEPCSMCCGAIINSRISRVVYGTSDPKAGSCGSVVDLFSLPYNHKPEVTAGLLAQDCSEILSDFFRELRISKQNNDG